MDHVRIGLSKVSNEVAQAYRRHAQDITGVYNLSDASMMRLYAIMAIESQAKPTDEQIDAARQVDYIPGG